MQLAKANKDLLIFAPSLSLIPLLSVADPLSVIQLNLLKKVFHIDFGTRCPWLLVLR